MAKNEKAILKALRETVQENRVVADGTYQLIKATIEIDVAEPVRIALLDAASVPMVFKLDPNDEDHDLLREAFAFCDLEPTKLLHWRLLLNSLVEVCFRKSGAPKKWDEVGLFGLFRDILSLQQKEPRLTSNSEIAKRLRTGRLFSAKYKTLREPALAKLVAKARNPEFNPAINFRNDPDLGMTLLRRKYEAQGKKWTLELENRIRPIADTVWQIVTKKSISTDGGS